MLPESNYRTILLIEDNDIDVEIIKRITRRLSLDLPIVRARNGLEALEILKQSGDELLKKPYLILLDINMPLMSGFEFLEHISQHGLVVDMPLYILSTSDAGADKSKAESYCVTGYLVKPIDKISLSNVLTDKVAHAPARSRPSF
jgi:CheY-like chemotaxis protein